MKILCSGYHRRLWFNLLPVSQELARRGHEVHNLYFRWNLLDNIGFESKLEKTGIPCVFWTWENDPTENRLRLAELVWKGKYDAVLVGEEFQAPDRYFFQIVSGLRCGFSESRIFIPVFVLQHGYIQNWSRLLQEMAADWFFSWGPYTISQTKKDPRFIVTGNPRFDFYDPADAEDKGYALVIALPNQITESWLKKNIPGDMPCLLKPHPDDQKDFSRFEQLGIRVIHGQADTKELIRCASVVIVGRSTCWIEAALYEKKIIPAGWPPGNTPPGPKLLESVLLRGGCAARICKEIEIRTEKFPDGI